MKNLNEVLAQASIANALIVDDAYDKTPLAKDLQADGDEWATLFADITPAEAADIAKVFPGYEKTHADELRSSKLFVETLWNHRAISPRLLDPLFARYEADKATDLRHLGALNQQLQDMGLKCKAVGREFEEHVAEADVVFIDLFLSSAQLAQDIELSIAGLSKAIEKRKSKPPLVVLMSRSTRLMERRAEFKDRAKLFESAFRIIRKEDIQDAGILRRLILRLASHYADTTKLAAFVEAWESSLTSAAMRTTSLIRKLGLNEIAQIDQLLLSAEGEPTGSYLVDVFDKVLQYEIEAEPSIINAAKALNKLNHQEYPPPFVPGANDLLELVHNSLFHNRARLELPESLDSPLAFGDILWRRLPIPENAQATQPLSEFGADYVLLVLTPACDLQRDGVTRILFLAGKLRDLAATDWTYKDEAKTPVCDLPDGSRKWIKWDVKHIETLNHAELQQLLDGDNPPFEVMARLRESHALELQQKLLSNMGRVGLIAPLPATFALTVEAYLPDPDGVLIKLEIPSLNDGGVCYVGRAGGGKPVERLILTEAACEAIAQGIGAKDLATVHERARELIAALSASGELLQVLEKGVPLPSAQAQGFKDMVTTDGVVVGLLRRAMMDDTHNHLKAGQASKAGIVLFAFDPNEEDESAEEGEPAAGIAQLGAAETGG